MKKKPTAPTIVSGRDIFVIKVAADFESDDVAAMKAQLKANGQSYSAWRKQIIEECKWAFDTWGLKLPKSRDSFEIAFNSIEDADKAMRGLEPEIRRYVRTAVITPISFGGIL